METGLSCTVDFMVCCESVPGSDGVKNELPELGFRVYNYNMVMYSPE